MYGSTQDFPRFLCRCEDRSRIDSGAPAQEKGDRGWGSGVDQGRIGTDAPTRERGDWGRVSDIDQGRTGTDVPAQEKGEWGRGSGLSLTPRSRLSAPDHWSTSLILAI